MIGVFEHFFRRYLLHVFVLLPLNNGEIQIYTFNPYSSPTNCGDLTPQFLRTIRSSSRDEWAKEILSTQRNKNFNGCPVIVATDETPPYITLTDNAQHIGGIDGEIVQLVADKLNFTIQLDRTSMVDGVVLPNKTATGIFKLVMEGHANMTIGDLSCTPERMLNLAFTPYYQTEMFGMVTPKYYTSMEVLLLPLSTPVLILGIILLLMQFIFKKMLLRIFKNNCFMQHLLQQKLLLILLYITIFYRLLYESTFFSFMQSPPRKDPPSTMKQLHEIGYNIISDIVSNNYMQGLEKDELNKIVITTGWYQNDSQVFLEQNKDSDICFITKMPYLNYFLKNEENMRKVRVSKKYFIYLDQNCYFFPKYSFLAESVDNILQRLRTFGIIEYIFSKQAFLSKEGEKILIYSEMRNWQPLNLQLISGPFKLYIFFLCVWVIFFLLEIYLYRFRTTRQIYELFM